MKKTILALSVFASATSFASNNNFYMLGGIGIGPTVSGPVITGGYQMNDFLGFEATGMFLEHNHDEVDGNITTKDERKLNSFSIAPTVRFGLTDNFYLGAKAGLAYSNQSRYETRNGKMLENTSSSGWGTTAGVFANYEFDVMTLRLAHDITDYKGSEGVDSVTSFNIGFKF